MCAARSPRRLDHTTITQDESPYSFGRVGDRLTLTIRRFANRNPSPGGTVAMARTLERRHTVRNNQAVPGQAAVTPTQSAGEVQAFEVVVGRLRFSFPELSESEVRAIVAAEVEVFDHARLRQFVPLLVERAARDACRHRAALAG